MVDSPVSLFLAGITINNRRSIGTEVGLPWAFSVSQGLMKINKMFASLSGPDGIGSTSHAGGSNFCSAAVSTRSATAVRLS